MVGFQTEPAAGRWEWNLDLLVLLQGGTEPGRHLPPPSSHDHTFTLAAHVIAGFLVLLHLVSQIRSSASLRFVTLAFNKTPDSKLVRHPEPWTGLGQQFPDLVMSEDSGILPACMSTL